MESLKYFTLWICGGGGGDALCPNLQRVLTGVW